jgi:hypothetical protein
MTGKRTVFMDKHEVKSRPLFCPILSACPSDNTDVKMALME